jgi:hypothetical protein
MLYANPAIVLKNSCEEETIRVSQQFLSFSNIPVPRSLSPMYTLLPSKTTHPKKHKYPKQLHPKPNQRPLHQDEQHARPESQRALPLLFAREEDKRPLRAEEERDADEEQDVAHGEQGAVEEEDQAEQEEEAAAAAEGDADFWWMSAVVHALGWVSGSIWRIVGNKTHSASRRASR